LIGEIYLRIFKATPRKAPTGNGMGNGAGRLYFYLYRKIVLGIWARLYFLLFIIRFEYEVRVKIAKFPAQKLQKALPKLRQGLL
jgi:hypothetical protein